MDTSHYIRLGVRQLTALSARAQRQLFLLGLIAADVIALGGAAAMAYAMRYSLGLDIFETSSFETFSYLRLLAVLIPFGILLFYQFRLYNFHYLLGGTQEYARVLNACSVGMMIMILATFFTKTVLSRGWFVLMWACSVTLVGLARFSMRRVAYLLRRHRYLMTTTLVVGADGEGRAVASQLRATPTCGADVIGFVDDKYALGEFVDRLPLLGKVEHVQRIVAERGVEEVILSTSALTRRQITNLYQTFSTRSDVELRLSAGLFEILTTGAWVKEWGYVPLVSINKVRLSELEMLVKTTLDYVMTLAGLFFLAPFLAMIALAVKLDSPGPVFYRRRVLGQGGIEFDALKFRTMYVNGDKILARNPHLQAEFQINYKLREDPRVTRVGSFLRKCSLDELPQLINVLMGQMSLVGPRMICPAEAEKYGKWKMNLLTVKPGITGMWQISGRSDISYGERVRLDMHYIRNYTIWLDLMILFRTIPAVLAGRGAY